MYILLLYLPHQHQQCLLKSMCINWLCNAIPWVIITIASSSALVTGTGSTTWLMTEPTTLQITCSQCFKAFQFTGPTSGFVVCFSSLARTSKQKTDENNCCVHFGSDWCDELDNIVGSKCSTQTLESVLCLYWQTINYRDDDVWNDLHFV